MRGTFLESPRRENKNLADRPETRPDRAETGRVITSDNVLLCELCGLIFLDFLDTSGPPPKSPGNTALQAGQLAVFRGENMPWLWLFTAVLVLTLGPSLGEKK